MVTSPRGRPPPPTAITSTPENTSVIGCPSVVESSTSTGVTNSATCSDDAKQIEIAASMWFFHAITIAAVCSAALPRTATTTTPMNTAPSPSA